MLGSVAVPTKKEVVNTTKRYTENATIPTDSPVLHITRFGLPRTSDKGRLAASVESVTRNR
jgi:hypothetical protein